MDATTLERDFERFRAQHDPAALARVFDAVAPKLLLLAAHLTRDPGAAEDLVQATFLAAMRDAERHDGRRPLFPWLCGILAHRAGDLARRGRLRATRPLEEAAGLASAEDPSAAASERELAERVSAAIDALDEPYREVLVLRTAHGLTPSEIAHALGRAPGTVRMQLARAREKLSERLPRELVLPALFLDDGGRGLAAVRAEVLGHVPPGIVVPLGIPGLVPALGAVGLVVLAVVATLAWRAPARTPWIQDQHGNARQVDASSSPALVSVSEKREPTTAEAMRVPVAAGASAKVPRIEGRVVTLAGAPAPFARITALGETPGRVRELATADAQGAFQLPPLAEGTLLAARKEGFQPGGFGKLSRTPLRLVGERALPLILKLGADGNALAGRVLDPQGAPVPGALLAVAVDEDARKQSVGMPMARATEPPLDREAFLLECDAEGRFASDEAPAGGALLLARPPAGDSGLVAWRLVEVRAFAANEFELVLEPGARIVGIIQDSRGRGVPGLELRSEWRGTDELGEMEDVLGQGFCDVFARSDADGGFQLAGLLPGPHEVTVRLGAKVLARERFECSRGGLARWDPEVEAQGSLAVRVLGPDGIPLAGWGLDWRTGDSALDREITRTFRDPVTLDAAGRARIASMDLREHVLRVFAPGARGEHTLALAERTGIVPGPDELVIELGADEWPSASLAGLWLDARGSPLADAAVWLQRDGYLVARCQTEANGDFRFERLPAGKLELVGSARDRFPDAHELARVILASGEHADLGALSLPDPVPVTLELAAEDGLPITDASVEFARDGRSNTLRPDPRTSLFPPCSFWPGPYELFLKGKDIAPLHRTVELSAGSENVLRLVCRRAVEVAFECKLLHEGELENPKFAGGGRIEVTVLDAQGFEILRERDWKPFVYGRSRIVRFSVRLGPGEYRARIVDHTWAREEGIERPTAEVAFRVPAGGVLDPVRIELR